MKNPAEDQPARPPLAGAPESSSAEEHALWLVSFADDDDRELRPPDIAEALRRGEIDGETIVWREGLADWTAIGSVPALARLLPASGATANAPLVMPNPAAQAAATAARAGAAASSNRELGPRARGNEPAKPAAKPAASPAPARILANAEALLQLALASTGEITTKPEAKPVPAAKPEPKPVLPVTKSAELGKGTTRLGLPKPPEVKRVAFTGASAPGAVAPKVTGARTPDPPRAAGARTPDPPRADRAPASSKQGSASIWDDEDDAPISVDPESIRPMSPTPGLTNATALSRGTLGGLPRKPPPAPRGAPAGPKPPPRAPAAPTPRADRNAPEDESVTAPLVARAAAPATDADFLGGADVAAPMLAPPMDFATAFSDEPTFSAEGPPLDAPVVDEETATVPTAREVTPRPTPATAAAKASATATTAAPAPQKKRSLVPFVLGGVAVAIVLSLGLRKLGRDEPASPAVAEAPAQPEQQRQGAPEPAVAAQGAPEPAAAANAPAPSAEAQAAPEAPTAMVPAASAPVATRVVTSKADPGTAVPTKAAHAPTEPAEPKAAATQAPEPAKKPEPAAAPEAKQVDMGGDFDQGAARTALAAAADQASGCRKDGDPTGTAVVHVTFANSGHATRATLEGPPFAGTPTGGCIAAALRGAKVPPFGGDRVTVTKRVVIH